MVSWQDKRTGDLLLLANGIVLLILVNLLSSKFFFQWDLTDEKRYSIHPSTREMLRTLDDVVYIEVFLEGELNADFRRFQKSVRETLEMFRVYANNRVQYSFTDPSSAMSQKARQEYMAELAAKGIQPTNVIDTRDGERIEKIIFPGAIVSYGSAEKGVMLLKGSNASMINPSIEGIEFELANAIYGLVNEAPKRIGLVRGHGELDNTHLVSFRNAITDLYRVRDIRLNESLSGFDALVIAKPVGPFSESEKYHLDQYIMRGGKVLFLVDRLDANMDSITQANYLAFPYETRLDDMLFRYGVRINPDLIQDRYAGRHPIITGASADGTPQIHMLEWPFFPLVNTFANHPITRNLDRVWLRFASSIDTVKAEGVTKTPLLMTSPYSRVLGAPVDVNVNDLRKNVSPEKFSRPHIPVAYLLEGTFTSLYRNRFPPEQVDVTEFVEKSVPTSLIVVSDGDLARNEVHPRTGEPLPLGRDPFSNYTYANQDLLLNMLAFLVDEEGLIRARGKEVRIRPLNREKIASEKLKWQIVNLGLPIALVVVFGVLRAAWRQMRYARF